MRYQQTSSESAELMRLILPRVARHGGTYVPTTYTVWFEYLSGINPALAEAIDARLKSSEALTQLEIEQLYLRHIDARDTRAMDQVQAGLGKLLHHLGDIAETSGAGTARFVRTLAECERELGAVGDPEKLQRVIQSLATSTAEVRAATESLQAKVEASRAEMQELRAQLGALRSEALTDPLTGLHNRRGLERELEQLYLERPDGIEGCAVLLADIDHFKHVNDTYGHLFGDQIIRAAAQALVGAIKGRDIAVRFGGEEFLLLLPGTPLDGARAFAEQIRLAFGRLRVRRSGEYVDHITISIGVAAPVRGESIEQAIDRADRALYDAKQAGRNCVRVAEPDAVGCRPSPTAAPVEAGADSAPDACAARGAGNS
jgi:diguanylate cyclase